jgi:uncharacterized membrane protein
MEVRRLRRGEWLALASALVLLGSLFATWYDRPAGARSGWEAFSVVDIVLSLAALCGIALAFLTATRRSPSLPVAFAVITIVLSALCVLVVAYRLAQPPGDDADPALGAFAGQAAVLALLAGAWLSVRDETRGTEHMPGVPVQDRPAPPPVT